MLSRYNVARPRVYRKRCFVWSVCCYCEMDNIPVLLCLGAFCHQIVVVMCLEPARLTLHFQSLSYKLRKTRSPDKKDTTGQISHKMKLKRWSTKDICYRLMGAGLDQACFWVCNTNAAHFRRCIVFPSVQGLTFLLKKKRWMSSDEVVSYDDED